MDISTQMVPNSFTLVSRDEWKARESQELEHLKHPIPYVVIHHSLEPEACFNKEQCSAAMRWMQDLHMDKNHWADIGYNFAVGSDGLVYEGQGWNMEGTHAAYFNPVSLGICLIGDWTNTLPPAVQIKTTQSLIDAGVESGYIAKDYRLVGHRQIRVTDCPGDALFEYIKTWDHYSSYPASAKDLLDIEELSPYLKERLSIRLKSDKNWTQT